MSYLWLLGILALPFLPSLKAQQLTLPGLPSETPGAEVNDLLDLEDPSEPREDWEELGANDAETIGEGAPGARDGKGSAGTANVRLRSKNQESASLPKPSAESKAGSVNQTGGNAEKEALEISKFFRTKISTQRWQEILKEKLNQAHTIRAGDTLWDLCRSLFGNNFLWPKLWSVNPQILNPHQLERDQSIRFVLGSEESLPFLSGIGKLPTFKDDQESEVSALPKDKFQSPFQRAAAPTDQIGMDRPLFQVAASPKADRSIYFPEGDARRPIGLLTSSPVERSAILVGEKIFVRILPGQPIGRSYLLGRQLGTMGHPSSPVRSQHYRTIGTVELSNQRVPGDLVIGTVTAAWEPINRGVELFDPKTLESVPASGGQSTGPSAQSLARIIEIISARPKAIGLKGDRVYLDVGARQGLKEGSVYNVVESDRLNKVTAAGVYKIGTVRVERVFENVSLASIASSTRDIALGSAVTLSGTEASSGFSAPPPSPPSPAPLDADSSSDLDLESSSSPPPPPPPPPPGGDSGEAWYLQDPATGDADLPDLNATSPEETISSGSPTPAPEPTPTPTPIPSGEPPSADPLDLPDLDTPSGFGEETLPALSPEEEDLLN